MEDKEVKGYVYATKEGNHICEVSFKNLENKGDPKMEDLKELQIKECIERLKILQQQYGLMEKVTDEFEKEGIVYYSEYANQIQKGILFWVSNNKEYADIIKEFEEERKTMVYHVILQNTEFGEMLTLLYVSKDQEEWETDKEELKEGLPCAYCINGDISEFGGIQIEGANGGINRIA